MTYQQHHQLGLSIEGKHPLKGSVQSSGAKNAALPILAASILLDGSYKISNIPPLTDVQTMIKMLKALRLRVEFRPPDTVQIWNSGSVGHIAPYDLVTAMRASFFVAGPILAKTGLAKVPLPGGCAIGSRPLNLHLKGFESLGATVTIQHGFVEMKARELIGSRIYLDFPSVGATENIMMAACLAKGETRIENAAQEPEIVDLGNMLKETGVPIEGLGTSIISIQGVDSLQGKDYRIIPDRVEIGTLMIAAAITDGDVWIEDVVPDHLEPLIRKMRASGVGMDIEENRIRIYKNGPLEAVDIDTLPFPGFPTDMQAQMMSLLTLANGTSVIKESIFENRFMHAHELVRMGANIKMDHNQAIITGVPSLSAAKVKITDLRAGAALILAGLAADGVTEVYGLQHLNRGYHELPKKLRELGARIS